MRENYKLCIREGKYFCITIPTKFVKKHSLEKADGLFFYLDKKNKTLVISPNEFPDNLRKSLNIEFLRKYALSKKGIRGWVTSVPEEWLLLIDGNKNNKLRYDFDLYENDLPKLIIQKQGE